MKNAPIRWASPTSFFQSSKFNFTLAGGGLQLFLLGRFVLPLLMFSLGGAVAVSGQGEPTCTALSNCADLKIEMVRVYDNLTNTCTGNPETECGDNYYQMIYKVYLRYSRPVDNQNPKVYLDYRQLYVPVALDGSYTYSRINEHDTQNCYSGSTNGMYWGAYYDPQSADEPVFNVSSSQVSISFANENPASSSCGRGLAPGNDGANGNRLLFDFEAAAPANVANNCPQNQECAYLELFTVVVDAYPGEIIRLIESTNGAVYQPYNTPPPPADPLCELSVNNSGNHNAMTSVTISNPPADGNILLELAEATASDPEERVLEIRLKNSGSTNESIQFVDFMLRGHLINLEEPLTYQLNTPVKITEQLVYGNYQYECYKLFYYHIEESILLGAGQTKVIGKVILGPSDIVNEGWTGAFSLTNTDKDRVKASGCTGLNYLDQNVVTLIEVGDVDCLAYNSLELVQSYTHGNCESSVRIGFVSSLYDQVQPERVRVSIEFDLPPGASLGTPDFTNWPLVCGSQTSCLQIPSCYRITNNLFEYCYANTQATTLFTATNGYDYIEIPVIFTNNECLASATVKALSIQLENTATSCVPAVASPAGLPLCRDLISGKLVTPLGEGVEDAEVTLSSTCTPNCADDVQMSTYEGTFGYCMNCEGCSEYTLTPELDNDHLNGVSTYDLVLINKHILGVETLNSPYKIINADANTSGTITTFDIVEIRKLILGIFNELPQNTSWRFIDKKQVFTNPANPFLDVIRENITLNPAQLPYHIADFIGCKIGDVNYSATANQRPPDQFVGIGWDLPAARSAKTITVPVVYTGIEPMEAFQFALRFDPTRLELIAPSGGDLYGMNADNFGLTEAESGLIRFSWFSVQPELGDNPVQNGAVLFNLTFKVLSNGDMEHSALQMAPDVMETAAWQADGNAFGLTHVPAAQARSQADPGGRLVEVSPNPTTGMVRVHFDCPQSGKARWVLLDAWGRRLTLRDVKVEAGRQSFEADELTNRPTGVYQYLLKMPDGSTDHGMIIKQ